MFWYVKQREPPYLWMNRRGMRRPDPQPLIEHWDGTQWSIVKSPNPSASNYLAGVAVVSATDIWAVGANTVNSKYQTLIEHWDGMKWRVVSGANIPNADGSWLSGVVAIATNNVWAVGSYLNVQTNITQTLVEHWDGTQWSLIASPNPGTSGNVLEAIAASSPADIWAAGYSNFKQGLIEHWDGTQWSVISSPHPRNCSFLSGITAVATNDVWAVGSDSKKCGKVGIGSALIEHWDGTKWRTIPSPKVRGAGLFSIAAFSTNNVWAVGSFFPSKGMEDTLTEHWNGSSWTMVPSPPNPGHNDLLFGVAVSGSDLWALGTYYDQPNATNQTLTEFYC